MSDKKSLEGKLRAIQELKSEKYIGTQEAWRYIQKVAALYDNPQKLAEAINQEVSKKGTLYYPATPARIVGLSYFYHWASISYESNMDEDLDDEEFGLDIDFSNPLSDFRGLIIGHEDEKPNPEILGEYFLPVFQDCQTPNISNKDFAVCAINKAIADSKMSDNKNGYIISKTSSADWDYQLSKENLRDLEKKLKQEIYVAEIDLSRRIERMFNDRVDHRLENRREILTDFIDSQQGLMDFAEELFGQGLSEQGPEVCYDSMVEILKSMLDNRMERLKFFEEISSKGDSYFESVKATGKRLVDEAKFLLTIFAPERNFVDKKYLKLKN